MIRLVLMLSLLACLLGGPGCGIEDAAAGGDPEVALAEYLAQQAEKGAHAAEVEKSFGKPFPEFTEQDYARFLESLDLDDDDDLWRWSHATDIPILALCRSSGFFYVNKHLLEDGERADRLGRVRPKTDLDPATGKLTLTTPEGEALPIRELPAGVIRATGRTGRYWYLEDFASDRVVYEALHPYLVRLQDLEYRDALGSWIRSLPLTVVKIYRGKGIFFTTVPGRSYAVAMPCSNATYKIFVGMTTGVFVDPRRDGPAGTLENFVHEFGHLVDYVVMKGGYGTHRNSNQFPEFRKAMPEKELVFGVGDDRVPQTPFGYVSRYSKANAQENFAEHFRAFILEKDGFADQARKEQAEGHSELMEKYRFMEKLLERTPPTLRRLSEKFLEEEAAWPEQSGRLARLYRARRLLGGEAPASLSRLLDETRAAAFREPGVRKPAAGAFSKALGRVIRDVARLRDRNRTEAALGLLLGVTLEVVLAPEATGARPALTATLRGAGERAFTGTLSFDTSPTGRFGAAARHPVKLEAAQTLEYSWQPDTGKDAGPFVALATAELRWGKQRLTLSGEAVCRPTIPVWWAVGPFGNPGGATQDLRHPPEGDPVDLKTTYPGPGERRLAWREVRRDPAAPAGSEFLVDLDGLLGEGKNVAGYAVVWAHSGKETDAVFSLGSADGVVAWVNGKRVLTWLGGRRKYASGSNTAPIRLKKGANEILVKITVTGKGWRFAARILDGEGRPLPGLRYGLPR